jgi:hypothetical protein
MYETFTHGSYTYEFNSLYPADESPVTLECWVVPDYDGLVYEMFRADDGDVIVRPFRPTIPLAVLEFGRDLARDHL